MKNGTLLWVVGLIAAFALGMALRSMWSTETTGTQPGVAPEAAAERPPKAEAASDAPAPPARGGGGHGRRSEGQAQDRAAQTAAPVPTLEMIERTVQAQEYDEALRLVAERRATVPPGKPQEELDLLRAQLLQAQGHDQDAFEVLDLTLADSSDQEILERAAARYYILARNGGFIEEALARQQQRVQTGPADPSALVVLAQLFEYAGRFDEAADTLQTVAEQDPGRDTLLPLANARKQQGQPLAAAEVFGRLAAMGLDDGGQFLLAKAQLELEADAAPAAYETAVLALRDPQTNPAVQVRLAEVIARSGRIEEAIAQYEHIATTAPDGEIAEQALIHALALRMGAGEDMGPHAERLNNLMQSLYPQIRQDASELYEAISKRETRQ